MDYLPYSDALETIQPDEAAMIEEIVAAMGRVNLRAFDKHRHGVRDAHAKSHGVLKGQLIVDAGLPAHLAQGLFARPGAHDLIIRLSSAPGDIHSDTTPAPLGMAVKILGVAGERLLPGDTSGSQDFLMVNAPTIPFGGVKAYRDMQHTLEQLDAVPDPLQAAAGALARGARTVLETVGVTPPGLLDAVASANDHILGQTFHSMAAIRFGDHVAKISAAPDSAEVKALTGVTVDPHAGDSAQRDQVVEFFRQHGAEYRVRVQLCTDLAAMPVEDASVLWPEGLSPQQPVARIVIPPQEAYSPARRVFADDVLSFSPWRGIAAHRPLGSLMRARIRAYEASSARRHELNAQPRREPADISELPD
jgi:hypothetical protein